MRFLIAGGSRQIRPPVGLRDLVGGQQRSQPIAQDGGVMVALSGGMVEPAIGGDGIAREAKTVRIDPTQPVLGIRITITSRGFELPRRRRVVFPIEGVKGGIVLAAAGPAAAISATMAAATADLGVNANGGRANLPIGRCRSTHDPPSSIGLLAGVATSLFGSPPDIDGMLILPASLAGLVLICPGRFNGAAVARFRVGPLNGLTLADGGLLGLRRCPLVVAFQVTAKLAAGQGAEQRTGRCGRKLAAAAADLRPEQPAGGSASQSTGRLPGIHPFAGSESQRQGGECRNGRLAHDDHDVSLRNRRAGPSNVTMIQMFQFGWFENTGE